MRVSRSISCGQVVLEVLERRVSIGSPVYESDHIVILGWLDNQRDEEVLWKLLSQVLLLCNALAMPCSFRHLIWICIGQQLLLILSNRYAPEGQMSEKLQLSRNSCHSR